MGDTGRRSYAVAVGRAQQHAAFGIRRHRLLEKVSGGEVGLEQVIGREGGKQAHLELLVVRRKYHGAGRRSEG